MPTTRADDHPRHRPLTEREGGPATRAEVLDAMTFAAHSVRHPANEQKAEEWLAAIERAAVEGERERLRAAVIEYLEADAAMPEFADAPGDWDALNRRWTVADAALRTALEIP